MVKKKPVWRQLVDSLPKERGSAVYLYNGRLYEAGHIEGWTLVVDLFRYGRAEGVYYETTRTKAVKYERKECNKCRGGGLLFFRKSSHSFAITVNNDRQWSEQCRSCNGKGYRLEAVK